ncbi:MAG: DUF1801 domain-containing protein [Gemmataceae bacterium]
MATSGTRTVDGFLADLEPARRDIVLALREVIAEALPTAEETVLWGGLSYHRPWIGGRVKGAVCQIGAKKGIVRLDFIHGVRLADPGRLLGGTGKSKRYVVIEDVGSARRPEIAELIREAAGVEWDDK